MDRRQVSIGQRLYELAEQGNEKELRGLLVQASSEGLAFKYYGCTALMMAAQNGYSEVVHTLLEHNADANIQDEDGCTALIMAAKKGHKEVVYTLLKHNADVDTLSTDKDTALMVAASRGHTEIVHTLLEHNAYIDMQDNDGSTALMMAAEQGHIEAVHALLKHKADVDIQRKDGNTALSFSASNDQIDVVEALLQHNANVNMQNSIGYTPLMVAAMFGHIQIVQTLLEHKADINMLNSSGHSALALAIQDGYTEVVHILLQHNADIHIQYRRVGNSALLLAAKLGHTNIVQSLLYHNADVNMKNKIGETALLIAVSNGHTEVVQTLLEHKADVNMTDNDGNTALIEAAWKGHLDIIRILLVHKVDVNITDNDGGTALFKAACEGYIEIVQTLIQHKADIDMQRSNGITALMIAACEGHIDIVQTLLQHSANINIQRSDGCTALIMAAKYGLIETVYKLLQFRAEVNIQDKHGNTALMCVDDFDDHGCVVKMQIMQLLIGYGADLSFQNKDGKTVIDLVNDTSLRETLQCLVHLHQSVVVRDIETVRKLLLQNPGEAPRSFLLNCQLNLEGRQMTALFAAAWKGYTEIVEIILQHAPSITVQQQATSALILAAEAGHCEVLKVLVQAGADWRAKDKDGRDLARSDKARIFLEICDDCQHLTFRCERVILLHDFAEKRKLFDSLSFEDPDWKEISSIGQYLQALKEKFILLSVSESDYGEQLDVLRSEVSAFCRKLVNENLLSVFPLVGKYHNQLKHIDVLNWNPNDLEADVSEVEEGFDREELDELKSNCEIMLKQTKLSTGSAYKYMCLSRGIEYVRAHLDIAEQAEETDFEVLAVLTGKLKTLRTELTALSFSEEEYLKLPEQCAEFLQSLHNICYQLLNAKQFKELAILAQYQTQLTNTRFDILIHFESPVLEELRSFEAQCQALLQESISDRERPQLYTRKNNLEWDLRNALLEEVARIQLEGELRDIDRKISELPLYNPTPLPARLSVLKEAILSYQAQFSEYVYPTDILSTCLDTLNRVDLSYLSPGAAVVDASVVSGGFDQVAYIDNEEQLQEGEYNYEDDVSLLSIPSCLHSTAQQSAVTQRLH